ncbi:aldehyde dehydrogenase family protein [Rhodoferax sp.]|uniref:aldehyde dehydrogenase family protein n=1 Tax=Rhodoferax sp. TaxID=50421 RepID=UPI00345180AB
MHTRMYVNGAWCPSARGQCLAVINPHTEELICEVSAGDAGDVDTAVAAAAAAFAAWSHSSGAQRAGYLRAIALGVEQQKDALAHLQSLNGGKPLAESAMDVADVIATFNYYAELAEQLDATAEQTVVLPSADFQASYSREPCGVVALIVPWNFPMVTTAWKLAPALAAGCTVVLKPSEVTPLPELALAAIIDAAGLPPGVFNVVPGTGTAVGEPLCTHPLVSKLSFTGSNAVGSLVMQAAAGSVKGVSLELGGKSPILVCADADMDLALSLVLGDPFDSRTQMGPLVSQLQYERVMRSIAYGLDEGLELVTGGHRVPGMACGYFVAPTIFHNVPVQSVLWREEIFGPVLCVRSFSGDAEALALANDSAFGLVATVVTADPVRAKWLARELQVGLVWINAPQVILPQTAWGA